MNEVAFTVDGTPVPQGSKRVVPTARGHRSVETNERTLNPWRNAVTGAAARAMGGRVPMAGPVRVDATFVHPRPRSHFGTGRNAGQLKSSAPVYCSTRPDVDKLLRAILDSITGVVVIDDGQVVELVARKHYGSPAAHITVTRLAG